MNVAVAMTMAGMALLALASSAVRDRPRLVAVVLPIGVFGVAVALILLRLVL